MKKIVYILSCLFLLVLPMKAEHEVQFYSTSAYNAAPVRERAGIRYTHSSQPLTTGHFQTSVQKLDGNGCAYVPGQSATHGKHVRKVSHDDDEDDPFMGNVVPITDTPWILFLLLAIGYGVFKLRKRSA